VPATLSLDALAPLRQDPARAAILLDIDGTLAPIVDLASDARVPERTRQLLGQVARLRLHTGCPSQQTISLSGQRGQLPLAFSQRAGQTGRIAAALGVEQ